ncbi:hypothetical protein J6355_08920 [Burkholderia pseudomallei]|nr:hypothetical protein [Burkholderia pseudomallei]MBO7827149.1 hypothetical protein [Burkholderia pseudomallei]
MAEKAVEKAAAQRQWAALERAAARVLAAAREQPRERHRDRGERCRHGVALVDTVIAPQRFERGGHRVSRTEVEPRQMHVRRARQQVPGARDRRRPR